MARLRACCRVHPPVGVGGDAAEVFSTVGFGDIAPKAEAARVLLIVQMLGDLAILGAGIRVLLGAVQRGRQQRPDTGGSTGPAAT